MSKGRRHGGKAESLTRDHSQKKKIRRGIKSLGARTVKLIRKGKVILRLGSVGTYGHQRVSRGAGLDGQRARARAQRTCANRRGRAMVIPVVLARSRPLRIVVVGHCFRQGMNRSTGRGQTRTGRGQDEDRWKVGVFFGAREPKRWC